MPAAGLMRTEAGRSPAQRLSMVFTHGSTGLGAQESLVLLGRRGPFSSYCISFFSPLLFRI